MKTNWPTKKLGEICTIKTGKRDANHGNPEGKYHFFTCAENHSYIDDYSFDTEAILIAGNGDVGAAKYFKGKFDAYQRTYVLHNFSTEVEVQFLFLFIDSFLNPAAQKAKQGGTMPYIKLGLLVNFEIPLPPLDEQKKIVKALEEKLEKVKEAIQLRQDAIADTEKILSAKLTEIFTEGKEKGWEEKTIDQLCEVARGGSPRPIKDYLTEDQDAINWVKISDASDSDRYIYKTKQKIKLEGRNKTRLVKSGDLLLTNSMSFGRPYIMKTGGAIHDGWLLLSPREKVASEYLYYFLSSPDLYRQFKNLAGGAVVQNLNSQLVRGVKITLPDYQTQEKIVEELDALSARVAELRALQETQLADLKSLERAYLHEAFNGKL